MGEHELDPDSDEAWARFARSVGPPLSAEERATIFRPSLGSRIILVVFFLIVVTIVAATQLDPGKGHYTNPAAWLAIPLVGGLCWRLGFVQRAYFDGPNLVIINLVRRYRIPLDAIVIGSCFPDRFGTHVSYRRPGHDRIASATAAAAETSPADRAFAKKHAEDFADLIDRAAAEAQGLT